MFLDFYDKKRIKISGLYICTLGMIRKTEDGYIAESADISKPYVILRLKEEGIFKVGVSPISGVKYYYFHDSHILSRYVGQVMMFKIIPLTQLNGIDRNYYTVAELRYLEGQLNKRSEEQDVIDDAVMQEIKKLSDLAISIYSKEKREEIFAKINSLGVFYVRELVNIRSNKNSELNINDPEKSLINECLRQIIGVEAEIKEELANSSLQRDLNVLQRSIRGN